MVTRDQGWARIGPTPALRSWAGAAHGAGLGALSRSAEPWRCGGTWFVGVDALPNDAAGAVPGGPPLPWEDLPLGPVALHPAQLSVIRPGYPRPSPEETPAASAYRRQRDAAHVDGLIPFGPARRRRIAEPHGFILGLPLNDCRAAPLVVWEGSHRILHRAFAAALADVPPQDRGRADITDSYHAARREVFATCPRRPLVARPGEALLLHRLTLHGTAPWSEGDNAPPEGRMIAFFRPMLEDAAAWLDAP